MKEYRGLVEAYQKVYEQQKIGVPTDNPDATLQKIIDKDSKYGGGKVVPLKPTKSANVQNAHYEPEGEQIDESPAALAIRAGLAAGTALAGKLVYDRAKEVGEKIKARNQQTQKAIDSLKNSYEPEGEIVSEDIFDEVLEYLISEGCTVEESKYIMTYVVEQGMHPQEVIGRGIANLLGFDKPHPTEVFARGLKKMLYPNKPVEVKAPKPPVKATTKPTASKPNPYRSGATVRATGPNLDKYPELQRFAGQAAKPGNLNTPIRGGGQGVSLPSGASRLGAAAAGLQAYNTGDATLSSALKRGDYKPKQGPKNPDQGLTKAQSFDKAYKTAKQKGGMGSTFTWNNKNYKVY